MSDASLKDIERIAKPGEVLAGKYLVDRVLGIGGMGAVVAATHTQLDQRVALKFLLPSMLGSGDIVERFLREARAAAKIKGEHVVRVSDVGTLDGGLPYIVMELLEGRDLGDLLARRGPLPVPLAVDYVLEACEALAEAHSAGIVHRDLKPSNLFLARQADDTEIIKVLDFGISKQISAETLASNPALTKTTDVFGSPTYMSPEQLKASRDVDVRADIWAIGVILYELLTAKTPFGGGTVAEIFGAILHQPAPGVRLSRKDVPAELERILLRCLEKDADKRFQNIGEMADALVPFGSDAARASTARVGRILRTSGSNPRASLPGVRGGPPSVDPARAPADEAVDAGTSPSAAGDSGRVADRGQSTSTSWGHIKPAGGKPGSRAVLAAAAVLAAVVAGAVVVMKVMGPAGGAGAAPSATSAPPSADPPAPGLPTTVVVPAASGAIAADPGTAASSAAPPSAPAASSSAAAPVRPTGATSTRPTSTGGAAAPTTAASPATTTQAPTPPPQTGGDDEFGGRK